MRLLAPSIFLLLLLPACQPDHSKSVKHQWIEEIQELAGKAEYQQEYVQTGNGERMFEQTQWTKIQSLDSIEGYHHLEVYNIYEEDEKIEYYVSEFDLILKDTFRQKIIDYQAVVEPDTVFKVVGVENNFKLDQMYQYEVEGDKYEVFKLFGYAHAYDKTPVHVKYWSPLFGTILIYSGTNETFELESFRGERNVIASLLFKIKEEMGRKRM